jgi:hypothetical protein
MDFVTATHYVPIITTVLSAIFFVVLFQAARTRKSGPHLAWWAFGALCYGAGTLVESMIALRGNSIELTKAWYITGALLGGFPLAQGAAYLHMKNKVAWAWGVAVSAVVVVASILVIFSPVIQANFELTRPTGKILGWAWIRWVTPIVNLYAFVVLVGGAIVSAVTYRRQGSQPARVTGNVLIAIGGLLPGIGGSLAVKGWVESLYVLELVGLVLMWWGYSVIAGLRTDRASASISGGQTA